MTLADKGKFIFIAFMNYFSCDLKMKTNMQKNDDLENREKYSIISNIDYSRISTKVKILILFSFSITEKTKDFNTWMSTKSYLYIQWSGSSSCYEKVANVSNKKLWYKMKVLKLNIFHLWFSKKCWTIVFHLHLCICK